MWSLTRSDEHARIKLRLGLLESNRERGSFLSPRPAALPNKQKGKIPMRMKTLVREVAKREGKKSQVGIGNIREVLAIVSDLVVAQPTVIATLVSAGLQRSRRKK